MSAELFAIAVFLAVRFIHSNVGHEFRFVRRFLGGHWEKKTCVDGEGEYRGTMDYGMEGSGRTWWTMVPHCTFSAAECHTRHLYKQRYADDEIHIYTECEHWGRGSSGRLPRNARRVP